MKDLPCLFYPNKNCPPTCKLYDMNYNSIVDNADSTSTIDSLIVQLRLKPAFIARFLQKSMELNDFTVSGDCTHNPIQ